MLLFWRTASYAFVDLKSNKGILEKVGVQLIENKIQKYKSSWVNQAHKKRTSIPKLIMSYKPRGCRKNIK